MPDRLCKKGKFDANDLKTVREAFRIIGIGQDSIHIESDWHYVNINGAVEIQPLLFDCRGALDTPSWIVRDVSNPSSGEPCSCGVMTRGGEVGTYAGLDEAIAAAVAELVRQKVLANLRTASGETASAQKSLKFPNDFIRHSLHT